MPSSSWSTMSDLFSLSIFMPKPSGIHLLPPKHGLSSNNSSLENIQDSADVPFWTPLPSPKSNCGSDSCLPSLAQSSYVKASTSLFFPSTASSTLFPSVRSSPNFLPLSPSEGSAVDLVSHDDRSLIDSSMSFVHMMRKTTNGGSPTSFLTCSSGWDPGVICEAVALPSLLSTPPSWDTLQKVAVTRMTCIKTGVSFATTGGLGLEPCSSLLHSQASSGSTSRIAMAKKVYLPPSIMDTSPRVNGGSPVDDQKGRIGVHDHDNSRFDQDINLPVLCPCFNPKNSKSMSPYASSPISDASSITSSLYEDPFHWDFVLSSLSCSPDLSILGTLSMPLSQSSPTFLPTRKSSPVLPRSSTSSLQLFQTQEGYSSSSSEPGLTSGSSSTSADIPTIVVMNPDAMSIPVQASISSIVGLYEGFPHPTEHLRAIKPIPSIPDTVEEVDEIEDEWHSNDDTDGDDSYDEADFEIVAVSALRTRLDTILEEDEMDDDCESVGNNGIIPASPVERSLKRAESFSSDKVVITGIVPSWTSSLSDASTSNIGPSINTASDSFYSQGSARRRPIIPSYSAASTARLIYCESGTSLAESSQPSADELLPTRSPTEGREDVHEGSQWFFHVEDGAILEIPVIIQSSSSSTTTSKIADKLSSFPSVPMSPFLSFSSPLPSSVLPTRIESIKNINSASCFCSSADESMSGLGLALPKDSPLNNRLLLSPTWTGGRASLASSSVVGLGLSSLTTQSSIISPSYPSFRIDFQDHNVDLGLATSFCTSSYHDCTTTGFLSDPPKGTSVPRRKERHVRFESADFRPHIADITRRRTKQKSTMAKKSCFKKKACRRPSGSGVLHGGTYKSELPSSFSSSSSLKSGTVRCRIGTRVMFSIGGRFLGGLRRLKGCWALIEKHEDDGAFVEEYHHGDIGSEGSVGSWRSYENDMTAANKERNAFYRRWRKVWS